LRRENKKTSSHGGQQDGKTIKGKRRHEKKRFTFATRGSDQSQKQAGRDRDQVDNRRELKDENGG